MKEHRLKIFSHYSIIIIPPSLINILIFSYIYKYLIFLYSILLILQTPGDETQWTSETNRQTNLAWWDGRSCTPIRTKRNSGNSSHISLHTLRRCYYINCRISDGDLLVQILSVKTEEDTSIFETTEVRMPALQTWTINEKNFLVTLTVFTSIMLNIFNGFPYRLHLQPMWL